MGHVRFRFSVHLPAHALFRLRKVPSKSLFQNILPLSPTRSRFCARFRVSSSKQGFCNMGGGSTSIPSFPIRETKSREQIPRLPGGGGRARDDKPFLTAPAGTPAAHAAVAASVAGHDGAADGATRGVAHVDQLFQGVGGVDVSGDGAAGEPSRQLSMRRMAGPDRRSCLRSRCPRTLPAQVTTVLVIGAGDGRRCRPRTWDGGRRRAPAAVR